MGPEPLSFAYFAAVKFAGYSAYAWYLRRRFDDHPEQGVARTLKIGGLRVGIGLVVGLAYGLMFIGLVYLLTLVKVNLGGMSPVFYFAGLLPVRYGEWFWLLRLAFKNKGADESWAGPSIPLGILVSYCLDVVGVLAALVLPGGIWIC